MAVYTKKGGKFDSTGKVLYGPVVTNTIFAGFGGQCEHRTSGDAVVRYDQLAKRWLYPLGPYYRYEFKRLLFPDYPRPAIWPDGYYRPHQRRRHRHQKQACVADRSKMRRAFLPQSNAS